MDTQTWTRARAVVFDAFGTLTAITAPSAPIRRLCAAADPRLRADVLHRVMREPLGWDDLVAMLGMAGHPSLPALRADLERELASVRTRPEAAAFWPWLAETGKPVGLCSNLALPYVAPCQAALPGPVEAVWSCHTGFIKPEPAIYLAAAAAVGTRPEHTLFVGDRWAEDEAGPQAVGMMSAPIGAFCAWAVRQ